MNRSALPAIRAALAAGPELVLPPPPPWLRDDPLRVVYERADALRRDGEVTFARLVMAHTAAWQPGEGTLAGVVVYSFDPWFQRDPDRLKTIAERVFALRAAPDLPAWPWERRVAELIRSDTARSFDEPLPPSLSLGRVVAMSAVALFREHLPGGRVQDGLLPVLVLRDGPVRPCLVVPGAWWPPALRARWQDTAA